LIVLNLVLAVVFLGASATFLGQKESWKKRHEVDTAKLKEEITDLTNQVSAKENAFRQQEQNANNFKNELGEVKAKQEQAETDLQKFKESYDKLFANHERLSKTYETALQNNDTLRADVNAANAAKETAQAEAREATEAANNATTEQKRLESELMDAQDQIAGLEKQIVELSKEIESAGVVLQAYKDKYGEISEIVSAPALAAKVSAVDEKLNIVVLSIGKDDGVKAGFTFTVYRGDQYVGKVVVDDVAKDHCSGYSRKELQQGSIQVGDDARTRW
jgi:chromosome segregation ATPase